jgi:signal transduction histidine kinase
VFVWLALLTVGANLLLAVALGRQADGALRARAEATASTVQVGSDGKVQIAANENDAALDVGTWIFGADGAPLEQPSNGSAALRREAAALAGRGSTTAETGLANRYRFLALPVSRGGAPVATVVTSTSVAPYGALRRLAWIGSAVLGLGVLLIVHLVLRANVGRALRPVHEMSAQADRWSAHDVAQRFGTEPRPRELAELARTLDGLLERQAAALRHEKQLTDELSHELRTPLARIQAELDLLRSRPRTAAERTTAYEAVADAATSMQEIIGTLMTTARATHGAPSGSSAPSQVLTRLTQRIASDRSDVSIRLHVDPALSAAVDAAVLERLVSPMLENALRYARSTVIVRGEQSEHGVRLTIEDDGPGVPEDYTEEIFQPGWRADPSDGHAGAGLGLALTRRLSVAAGGQVIARSGGPGAAFVVELPAG